MATCPSCRRPMPAEHKAAGFARCITCSPQFELRGANVYGHKTAGAVELMHPATYNVYRRVTARKAKDTRTELSTRHDGGA